MNSLKNNQQLFDYDYYENGVKTGISGYQNYSWMPTRSIPEAISIIEKIQFNTVMDFGCAKGFLVHALNLLGKDAIGVDISEYALNTCLPQVKDKLHLIDKPLPELGLKADLLIAKDVLEHIPIDNLKDVIDEIFTYSKKWVFISVCCRKANAILPNGYNAHATIESAKWWREVFKAYKNNTLEFSE